MLPKKTKRRIKTPTQAVLAAVKKTADVVTGRDHFKNDFEARAALTLARLGKNTFDPKNRMPSFRETMPHLYTPKYRLLFRRMDYLDTLTPKQHAEWDRRRDHAYAMMATQKIPSFACSEEAAEFFRKHHLVHTAEIEESLWPPYLRFDTIGLDYNGNEIKPEGDDDES